MRTVTSLVLLALASPAAADTTEALWTYTAFFEIPGADEASDAAPLDFSLSFQFPGGSLFAPHVDDLLPDPTPYQITVTSANAAAYGINWAAMSDNVENHWGAFGANFQPTASINTPLGTFAASCCESTWLNKQDRALSEVAFIITRFGRFNEIDPAIYFVAETILIQRSVTAPEPSCLLLLLGCVGFCCVRRHRAG